LPYPTNRQAVSGKLESEKFITSTSNKNQITNLGGILIAKNINEFDQLSRKAVRVIVYKYQIFKLKRSTLKPLCILLRR
jgi:predicted HTH transcriptional regulator